MGSRGLLFLALVGRHLMQHRLRAGLTLQGVALGVAVAVAVQLANHSALAAFEGAVRNVAGEARLEVSSPAGDLDERVVTRLRPITDAARLEPVIEGVALWAGHPDVAFRLLGVDMLSAEAFRGYGEPRLAKGLTRPQGVFITATAAERLRLSPGSPLPLWLNDRREEVTVAGVLPGGERTAALDPMVAFTDVATAQEWLGRVGRLDHVDLVPRGDVSPQALRPMVAPLLAPGEQVVEPQESGQQASRMLAAFRTNMWALSYVALIVGAFARQHEAPNVDDYETLLRESAEMAWISTEGNAFNHATDRVADVFKLSDDKKAKGRPMKPEVERSRSGRVFQTAYRADIVLRELRRSDGGTVKREVPGSFYEFITRKRTFNQATRQWETDLRFDAGNATGIFKMTANAANIATAGK